MNKKLVMLYFGGQLVSIAAAVVATFWSAGRLDWWPGWAVLAVWMAWFASVDVVVLGGNPELMAERMSPPKEAKNWDRTLLSVVRLV